MPARVYASRIRRAASARRPPPSTSPLPRRGRRAAPADRPRPPGERHLRAWGAGERHVDPRSPRRHPAARAGEADRVPNLDLVPSKPELAGGSGRARRCAKAASAISPRRWRGRPTRYSFVFLDCPPSFGPLTVNALAAADRVIVPVQAEYYALEGLTQLLGSINLVKARLNPDLAVAGILLTMVDGRTRLAPRSRARCAGTSAHWSSRRPCLARCVSPRRRATGSP